MANPSVGIHKGVKAFPTPLYVVEFTDKDGTRQTKLVVIIGHEARFVSNEALSAPLQQGLTDSILIAAGIKDPHHA